MNLKDELELKIVVRSERGARILSAMMRAYEGSATVCAEGVLRVWNPLIVGGYCGTTARVPMAAATVGIVNEWLW